MGRESRTFVKLDDHVDENPKLLALDDGAFRLYVHGLAFCSRNETNGEIPKTAVWKLHQRSGRLIGVLVRAGLWIDKGDHYYVHDYLKHQRSREEIEGIREAKRMAGRKGANSRWDGKRRDTPIAPAIAPVIPPATEPEMANGYPETETETETETDQHPTPPSPAPQDDADFEKFWETYPKRNGKRLEKPKALASWRRMTKTKREKALVGVGHYRAACDAGLTLAKDAFRWLRDESWVDWQSGVSSIGPRRPTLVLSDEDRARIEDEMATCPTCGDSGGFMCTDCVRRQKKLSEALHG